MLGIVMRKTSVILAFTTKKYAKFTLSWTSHILSNNKKEYVVRT